MATKRVVSVLPPVFNNGLIIDLPVQFPLAIEWVFLVRIDEIPEVEPRLVPIAITWDPNAETFQANFVRARDLAIDRLETEQGTHTVVSD